MPPNPAANQNNAVAQLALPAFICPSDASSNGGRLTGRANVNGGINYGVTNYKLSSGSNWAWGSFVHSSPGGRHAGNTNGLDAANGFQGRRSGAPICTNVAHIRDGLSNTFAAGEAIPGLCTHTMWYWFNGATATAGVPLNHYIRNLAITPGDWPNNYSFASYHTGGGTFLMADGSVKFLSEDIDLTSYRNLSTIDSRDPVPALD